MKVQAALIVMAGTALVANAQVTLTEVARIDVDAQFNNLTANGTNPSAVAWDGTNLFVAGFNGGTSASAGIAQYDAAGNLVSEFGSLATPGSRGYSGLDISNGTLAAAYDDGATDPNGLSAWDMSGTQLWAASYRGGSGVGFDSGYGGAGAGVASTTFGSGRRALYNTPDGAAIYTSSNGMIINGTGTGTFWRDMDFDDDTGDMWIREGNNVIQGVRNGANSLSGINLVVDATEADFVAGQNISFLSNSGFGDLVIYNDRTGTGLGQSASDVIKLIMTDGTAVALSFDLLGGGSLDTGAAFYDFSYDEGSQTLAVLDFSNRNVHIFNVPTPASAALLGLGGFVASRRRRS